MDFKYDVIVIGAGHAGCEAAGGGAHLGAKNTSQLRLPIWAQRPA